MFFYFKPQELFFRICVSVPVKITSSYTWGGRIYKDFHSVFLILLQRILIWAFPYSKTAHMLKSLNTIVLIQGDLGRPIKLEQPFSSPYFSYMVRVEKLITAEKGCKPGWTRQLTCPIWSMWLFVNFIFWNDTTCLIHCEPVPGESGWIKILVGIRGSAFPVTDHSELWNL